MARAAGFGRRRTDGGQPFRSQSGSYACARGRARKRHKFVQNLIRYGTQIKMKKLWIAFALVMGVSFSILGWIGTRIYQEKPPIPAHVVTTAGVELVGNGAIERGQNVWQSMGGMEVGSLWGHGSYVAPDWTADWLHRELTV